MFRSVRSASAVIAMAAVVCLELATASASDAPVEPPTTDTFVADPGAVVPVGDVDPAAAATMAAERGITVAEATLRLGRQQSLGDLGVALEAGLAGRSGGSYLDADGNLVVTTLDAAADTAVTKAGARAARVDDSSARLDSIMRKLDRQAAHGSGGLHGWYIDVPTNTVVVTVTEGASDARTKQLLKSVANFGSSVRVEYSPAAAAPAVAAEYLAGGMQIVVSSTGGTCSVGFNTVDASNRPVILTAGHCVNSGVTASRNGFYVGAPRTKNFPGDDFGTFWNAYPTYWIARASVYTYAGYQNVRGSWGNPPVGATVCKSGRTTGWTCGTITARNVSVSYKQGVVSGLVQHNACVEPGDSGGSNMSSGGFALGVTSGSNYDQATGKCQSKFGRANTSFYQPIAEALTRNNLRLLVAP